MEPQQSPVFIDVIEPAQTTNITAAASITPKTTTAGAPEPMTPNEADAYVVNQIEEQDKAAASMTSTTLTDVSVTPVMEETPVTAHEVTESVEDEDPIVTRLKRRVESMVDKIEVQLTETEVKIGDKMHFLDKDRDGILSREEVAEALQHVLKKEISFEEAMEIADKMVSRCCLFGAMFRLPRENDEVVAVSFIRHSWCVCVGVCVCRLLCRCRRLSSQLSSTKFSML